MANQFLVKTAAIPGVLQRLGHRALASGGGAALGGVGGAGLGALTGGVRGALGGDEDAPGGLRGALRGALSGAGVGGALGLAAGGGAGALGGARAQKAVLGIGQRPGILGGVARFGQTQAHSLTGALPKGMSRHEGLKAIGASPAERIQRSMTEVLRKEGPQSKKYQSLLKGHAYARQSEELGLTHVPGFFKSILTSPVRTVKAGLKREWYGNPTVGSKALAFGLPTAMVGGSAASKGEEGSTRTGRALGALGGVAGFAVAPMGVAGDLVSSSILEGVGSSVGNRTHRALSSRFAPRASGGAV